MFEDRARILLVDDHALFRESLARFLNSESISRWWAVAPRLKTPRNF